MSAYAGFDPDLNGFSIQESNNLMLGQNGAVFESGTTALTAQKIYCIHCVTDTVFATLTNDPAWTGDTFTGVTIPAGTHLFGRFSAVTLTSGSIIGYKYA